MLAVQQIPRMGPPTQHSSDDPLLPFGYAVDPNEPTFDPPPEPAPGAPLLTDTDSKFLTSFFEDMTANQYNMPSFGEGLNFSEAWLDLPPQFMGTATSFGQHDPNLMQAPLAGPSQPQHADPSRMMPVSQLMPPPPAPLAGPSQPHPNQLFGSSQVSNGTLDPAATAAATLLQNASASRHGLNHQDFATARRPIPVGHLRHQPLEEFREEGRRGSHTEAGARDNTMAAWMFAGQGDPSAMKQLGLRSPADFQFGSDANFQGAQGYTPDPVKNSIENQQQDQLRCLDCLEISQSTDTTRQNSPSFDLRAIHASHSHGGATAISKAPEDTEAPPRKRRKSKVAKSTDEENDDADSNPPTAKPSRRRKSKAEPPASPVEDSSAGSRRRKSTVNGTSKGPRENLSEEQKRENHIKSEQRRRTLIKEGFEDLCIIVPALKGGGFSKSTMLTMAAEWLEEMLEGNEALEKQLASLKDSK